MNPHAQTIYPALFRKINDVDYTRERITTPDHDFIDLDWSPVASDQAVIVSHGLEGHSQRSYMRGMIKAFNRRGLDGIAFNFRGCSGETNRQLRSYHSGATEDLHTVVCHVLQKRSYKDLFLVGFSIGGNLTLKYIGEKGSALSPRIKGATAISVPCDLESCARQLEKPSNGLYMRRFLKMFHKKIRSKMLLMPEKISDKDFASIRSFMEFDERYTAPIHGFSNAKDYYSKCSCKPFLSGIKIPTLLINALDDPFLPKECYPIKEAKESRYCFLETPRSGGHVGFVEFNPAGEYWHERRAASFVSNIS
ncbi:MAG: alpha/beta fold hydrolase [Desulfobacterales bacterium]|nr:MAG: alpha/beta fold hydrolase [Desulfobacterales bacterium]